jgi:hypothetical protein
MDSPPSSPENPYFAQLEAVVDGLATNSLFFDGQDYDADLESPNDMMVDPEEFVPEQPESEKDNVAIIDPDHLGNDTEMADKPRADDCMSTTCDPLFIQAMR